MSYGAATHKSLGPRIFSTMVAHGEARPESWDTGFLLKGPLLLLSCNMIRHNHSARGCRFGGKERIGVWVVVWQVAVRTSQ